MGVTLQLPFLQQQDFSFPFPPVDPMCKWRVNKVRELLRSNSILSQKISYSCQRKQLPPESGWWLGCNFRERVITIWKAPLSAETGLLWCWTLSSGLTLNFSQVPAVGPGWISRLYTAFFFSFLGFPRTSRWLK